MARDRERVSDDELDELEEAMDEQRDALTEALVEDLGGEPDEDRPGREPPTDAGEE